MKGTTSMIEYLVENELILFAVVLIGTLGYWIASGAARADYKTLHVTLGIALFTAIGGGVYWIFGPLGFQNPVIGILISFVTVLPIAFVWRRWASEWLFNRLRDLHITTTSFGPSRAWDVLESTPDGREFHYIRVHLADGTELGSNQTALARKRQNKELDFPPDMLTDEQGNVVIIVTETWEKDADTPKENNPVDSEGRTEFTYIPASNITRIQAYIKPKSKI